MRLTLILLCVLLAGSGAIGATIYVATTGNDTTGNGSAETPYATITKAISVATANVDTISVAGGTYNAEKINGTAANGYLFIDKAGLTFTATGAVIVTVSNAAAGRVARITNGSNNTTFNASGSGSWTFDGLRSDASYCATAMEINATATPNTFEHCTFKRATTLLNFGNATITATCTDCTFTDGGENIASARGITGYDVDMTMTRCDWALTGGGGAQAINLLGNAGDTATSTLQDCTFGTTAAPLLVSGGVINNEDSSTFTIDGCTAVLGTAADGFYKQTGASGTVTITDSTVTYVDDAEAPVIQLSGGNHAPTISRNTIAANGAQTQDVLSLTDQTAPVITDNTLTDNGTTATIASIRVTTSAADKSAANALIRNNTVRRPLATGGYTILVGADTYSANSAEKCDGAVIEYNRIYGLRQADSFNTHGIMIGYSRGTVRYNYVYGCGYGYIAKSGTGTPQDWTGYEGFHHNISVDARLFAMLNKAAHHTRWEHNTCYRSTLVTPAGAPIIVVGQNEVEEDGAVGNSDAAVFRYNILYSAPGGRVLDIRTDQTNTVFEDNCFYVVGADTLTYDLFVLGEVGATLAEFVAAGYTDPGTFANPRFRQAGRDFRLLSTSPCINPDSTARLMMRSERLYIPQYAWGALAPAYEPLKPIE